MPTPPRVLACNATVRQQWAWGRGGCARQRGRAELLAALGNKTVLFMGDSHARYVYSQLMELMGGPPFGKWEHHAGRFDETNATMRFVWAPTMAQVVAYIDVW